MSYSTILAFSNEIFTVMSIHIKMGIINDTDENREFYSLELLFSRKLGKIELFCNIQRLMMY